MKFLVPAIIAGCAFVSLSHAQDNKDFAAPEVVVTATRFEGKPTDQPIGVTVITADEIQRSGESSLPRLLARQPGILVRDNSGSPDNQVDMRGFGVTGDQNTLVLVDGRRLSEYELTSARWSSIPIESIERIEIVRGSGAVLYGNGATGGVINIITRGPKAGGKTFDVYAGVGSYDSREIRIGGQVAGDTVGLDLRGGHSVSDNYRENNRVEQNNVVADIRNFDADRTLILKVGADNQNLRLPGNRTEAELETDRRGTRTPTDYSNRSGGFAALSGSFRIGDAELLIDGGYREKKNDFHAAFFGLSLDGTTEVETLTFSPRLKLPYTFLGTDQSLVVGGDWEDWDYSTVRTNPASATATQNNSAVFLQNVSTFSSGTIVSLGGRAQRIEFEGSDSVLGPLDKQVREPSAYEIGLRHEWAPGLAMFGKYGYSFRIATLDEVYSPGLGAFFIPPSVTFLEPQTSHDSELGMELRSAMGSYRISAFKSELKDEIHFDSNTGTNVNLTPTKRAGVEVEGKWTIANFGIFANYTYLDARFRSGTFAGVDVSGKRIPLVPRHMGNIGVDWAASPNTRLNAVARYVGEQLYDGDEANTFGETMPSYWTADLAVFHEIKDWTFGLSIRNLLDEKYYTYALAITFPTNTFVAYPAPERNFFLSAQYRFGP